MYVVGMCETEEDCIGRYDDIGVMVDVVERCSRSV